MNGPFPLGTRNSHAPVSEWDWERGYLARGQRYRVVRPFVDVDGDMHPVGEEWIFLGSGFSRFEDDLFLFVRMLADDEWEFCLRWRPGFQLEIIENFLSYVNPVRSDGTLEKFSGPQPRRIKVVTLTPAAVKQARVMCNAAAKPYLRLTIRSGHSTTFYCDFVPDHRIEASNDYLDESQGIPIVVDIRSSLFLDGKTIDWQDKPQSVGFTTK